MRNVVGLTGLRGSGKDTAAKVLIDQGWVRLAFADPLYREVAAAYQKPVAFFENRATKETPQAALALINCLDRDFVRAALKASGVARSVRRAFDDVKVLTRPGMHRRLKKALKKAISPRNAMQWWGTDYRRVVDGDDYWRKQVADQIAANPSTNYVITDVRFPDEANLIKSMGGKVARVVRPSQASVNDPNLMHASEQAMLKYEVALVLTNEDGAAGLQAFHAQVKAAFLA